MDITPISGLVNVVLIPVVAALALKIKQMTPQINRAFSQAGALRLKSNAVLGLFDKLENLTKDLTSAAASGDISNEEAQTLLAEVQTILADPAVKDLKNFVAKLE